MGAGSMLQASSISIWACIFEGLAKKLAKDRQRRSNGISLLNRPAQPVVADLGPPADSRRQR